MSKVLPVDSIKLNVRTVYQSTELEKTPLHYNKNVIKKQTRSMKKFNRKKLISYIQYSYYVQLLDISKLSFQCVPAMCY